MTTWSTTVVGEGDGLGRERDLLGVGVGDDDLGDGLNPLGVGVDEGITRLGSTGG